MSLEQPINAFSWEDPMAQAFISDISADLVAVSACAYGKDITSAGYFVRVVVRCGHLRVSACTGRTRVSSMRACVTVMVNMSQGMQQSIRASYLANLLSKKKSSGDDGGEVTLGQALQRMPCKGAFEGPWGNQHGGSIYSVPDWSATNVSSTGDLG